MTVGELIENLQATEDMDKEILLNINGERYTIVTNYQVMNIISM